LKRKLVTAGITFLMIGAVAPAASADVGDGQRACNSGEICISADYPASRYQRHFWYAANHTGYFSDVVAGGSSTVPLQNHASSVSNRDSACDARIVNDRGILPDSIHTFAQHPTYNSWLQIIGVNDANDRHERVNC
jgi:hypothetical protein